MWWIPDKEVQSHLMSETQLGEQRAPIARIGIDEYGCIRGGDRPAHIILDARELHCQPKCRKEDSSHSGFHPRIMQSFADLPASAKWFASAVMQTHAWGNTN